MLHELNPYPRVLTYNIDNIISISGDVSIVLCTPAINVKICTLLHKLLNERNTNFTKLTCANTKDKPHKCKHCYKYFVPLKN